VIVECVHQPLTNGGIAAPMKSRDNNLRCLYIFVLCPRASKYRPACLACGKRFEKYFPPRLRAVMDRLPDRRKTHRERPVAPGDWGRFGHTGNLFIRNIAPDNRALIQICSCSGDVPARSRGSFGLFKQRKESRRNGRR
jgi:hypothetical protein